jgi:hypothetical protein
VRSEFRDVDRLPRGGRFLRADIPVSMHAHAGGCRVIVHPTERGPCSIKLTSLLREEPVRRRPPW